MLNKESLPNFHFQGGLDPYYPGGEGMGGWVWVVTIKYNAKSVQLNLPTQIELSKNKIINIC